jgi:hypothetical protein
MTGLPSSNQDLTEEGLTEKLRAIDAYRLGGAGWPVSAARVKQAADEIDRLRALVPTGDYVLVEDMDESNDRRWGKGLFTCFDNIKSVS